MNPNINVVSTRNDRKMRRTLGAIICLSDSRDLRDMVVVSLLIVAMFAKVKLFSACVNASLRPNYR